MRFSALCKGWVVQFSATFRGWVTLFYNIDRHTFFSINQSINQSTLLVHSIKMGFHMPITIKSNMNNRNLK